MNPFIIAVLLLAVPGNGQCIQVTGRKTEKRGVSNVGYGGNNKPLALQGGGYTIGLNDNQGASSFNGEYDGGKFNGFYEASGSEAGVPDGNKFTTNGGFKAGFGNGYDNSYGNGIDAEAAKGRIQPTNMQNHFETPPQSQQFQGSEQPQFVQAYRSFPSNIPGQQIHAPIQDAVPQAYPISYSPKVEQSVGIPMTHVYGNSQNGFVGGGQDFVGRYNGQFGGGFVNGIKGGLGNGYKSNLAGGHGNPFASGLSESFSGGRGLGASFGRGYRSLGEGRKVPHYAEYNGGPAYTRTSYIPTH